MKLEVGSGGFARLSLQRGGTVRVFPGSSLTLSGPGELLELSSGKVWCLVEPGDVPLAVPFMVKTDAAEVRAIGTSFVVERRQSGETDVRVAKGVVEVKDIRTGQAVRIDGCYETRFTPGSSPNPPGRYSPKHDRSDWNAVFETGGG
jgi:ferric-dicitrate binding protein FerR (iron transport regulator)